MKKRAKKFRSQIETKRPHQKKGAKAHSSRPQGRRESGGTAIGPSTPAKIVDASKKEARELSQEVQEGMNALERKWWHVGRLIDACMKRHVPRALGLTAKQWMEKYLEGSLSDAFRKMRVIRGLAGVPEEKINSLKQANATQLLRLPEAERKSEEWLDRAAKEPISEFKERVDKRLEERGIPREKFRDFYLKAPVGVIGQMEAAEKKIAAMLGLNTFVDSGWRIPAWEAIAVMVNTTPEEKLQIEMVGAEK